MLKTELRELTKDEIIDLVDSYDTYITDFVDDNAGHKLKDDVIPMNLLEYMEDYFYWQDYDNRRND